MNYTIQFRDPAKTGNPGMWSIAGSCIMSSEAERCAMRYSADRPHLEFKVAHAASDRVVATFKAGERT